MRKAAGLIGTALITGLAGSAGAQTAELPVPCVAGVCGANIPGFVSSGRANATITNGVLRVQQQSDRAILNWASFNVGADGRVVFEQPNASSIALNRIFQGSPSRILGAIEANGQIYLVNQNGFLFGPTARVRTAGFLASSLAISDAVFENGLLSPDLVRDVRPALESDQRVGVLRPDGTPVLGDDGQPLAVKITLEQGARISTIGSGQRVMIASRTVDNAGEITAPDGQVILAAGEKVYLQASTDPALRGLLVEVDAGGDAWNRMTGNVSAARGNVTMVGLAVNQQGRISATSSVNANGSIRLLARDSVVGIDDHGRPSFASTNGGRLEIGGDSRTTVLPEIGDRETAIDEQLQMPSRIELHGRQVYLRSGAAVTAPGGEIHIDAVRNANQPDALDPESRVRVESGVRLDASGSTATASVTRNVVRVELRGNELRDAPLQRDGALRGREVFVDARVGTPLADVSGAVANIGRAIDERTATGGTIALRSAGDIVAAPGAVFDVSGGRVNYEAGVIQTTQLLTADGRAVDIGRANPDQLYVGLINPSSTRSFDRWGVTERVQGPLIGHYEPGYVEGKSAGTLIFNAPSLALGGDFLGHAIAGPYQRDAARAPQGGRFVIGDANGAVLPDYRAPSINLTGRPAPVSVGDDAILPRRPLDLAPDFATQGGFTRTELYSNGVVHIPESLMLVLAPGSSLRITAHRVEANGSIATAGGSLRFAAVETPGIDGSVLPRAGVAVGENAVFDVRGAWSNELSLLTPIYRDGGEIDFNVSAEQGELRVGAGTRLLADGGASLSTAGTVTGGRGGHIGLRANGIDGAIELGDGIGLSAFGVAGARGGSLVFEAPRLELVEREAWIEAGRLDLRDGNPGFVSLGSGLFANHGFASFDLAATGPEADHSAVLAVREGTHVDAQARTLALMGDVASRPSGGPVEAFARSLLSPDYARAATSVSLRVEPRAFIGAAGVGLLDMEPGSSIRVGARGSVSLSSVGGMNLAGSIEARAGSVTAALPTPGENWDVGYRDDLGIRLAPTARVDVSGIALLRPSDAGLLFGEVHAGGSVSLLANRGFVDVAHGAVIDISGASQTLDIASAAGGYARRRIASNGGALTVRAPESLSFQATLRAQAGSGDTPAPAGSIAFQLTRQRGFEPRGGGSSFPDSPRTLLVVPDLQGATLGRNGIGIVDTSMVRASGADRLVLEAEHRIEFYSGSDLSMGRSLQVAAPLIGVSGDALRLAAPFVSIGDSLAGTPAATQLVPGAAQLSVRGDLIEFAGDSAFTGVAHASFEASREIRVRGAEQAGESRGSLAIAGDLTLRAPLVYPTTLTRFQITAAGGARDAVRFESTGTVSTGTPLSAGGEINVSARSISQGTRVVAPFGAIRLDATEALTLADGSVTSVSAAGELLPFGRTQLGNQWLYELGAVNVAAPALDARSVDLSGATVSIATNATIDLTGGGDLYAYEFLPGTGGSRDALKAGETPGLYAILPQLRNGFAPYDSQEYNGSDLSAGDSIYLSGLPGLEAGVYPLLPARYALLPGALLISAVPGAVDALPGVGTRLADGTPVVAGYRTFAATGLRDARYSGFAVRPGSHGRRLANYQDSRASTFDPGTRPVAPADAGRLSLSAGNAFALQGRVRSAAATGGRGASIDVSATNLVVTRGATNVPAGAVGVDAGQLQQWNAASLLLGGRRNGGGTIDVTADSVTIGEGARLSGSELLAVAREELQFRGGSLFESPGALPAGAFEDIDPLRFGDSSAGAAVVATSANRVLHIERAALAPGTTGGAIDVDANARLASRGSLLLDAPRSVSFAGDIDVTDATLSLGSSVIAFGGLARDSGLTLDERFQAGLAQARNVRLAATGGFEFVADFSLGTRDGAAYSLENLELAAGVWRPVEADVNASFAAANLTLSGAPEVTGPMAGPPAGVLAFAARDLTIAPGYIGVEGFSDLSISATREIVGRGTAGIRASGNIDLTAGNLGTGTGADLSIVSGGTLRTGSSGAGSDTTRRSTELGGRLRLAGDTLQHQGAIRIGSGRVELIAATGLELGTSSLVDVSGATITAAGRTVNSSGGSVLLESGGTLTGLAGGMVDVSGGGGSDAGRVTLRAADAANLATRFFAAAPAARGGSFELDAGTVIDFDGLNTGLEQGNFSERRVVRAAAGDLTLAAGRTMSARHVELTTGGALAVHGTINASSDNERGRVVLAGGTGLDLASSARLIATGATGTGRGGHVSLESTAGTVNLVRGSVISLGGTNEPGALTIRAAATGDGMRLGAFDSTISGVDAVTLQPLLDFALAANPNAARFTQIRNEVTAFANANSDSLRARFGTAALPVVVRPGIEMHADGNLTLGSLDLAAWRFAGQPADLAFHAAGSIALNANAVFSDGFVNAGTASAPRIDLIAGPSSSIYLDAGEDLNLGANSRLRTGTGDIHLRAGGDLRFGNGASVYTAGVPAEATHVFTRGSLAVPTGGGQISIDAGGDVVGMPVNQAVGDWLVRQGRPLANPSSEPGWGVDLQRFRWNVGSFGGGDVAVRAGHDVRDLSVAAANSASRAGGRLAVYEGGVTSIVAGNDIDSAVLHASHGRNLLRAEGEIGRADEFGGYASLFSMQDAAVDLVARRGIVIESVFDPMVLPHNLISTPAFRTYFFTYSGESSLRASTAAGDLTYAFNADRLRSLLNESENVLMSLLPPNVMLRALDGDIRFEGPMWLFPSDAGNFELFASRDIWSPENTEITMSDAAAAAIPSVTSPVEGVGFANALLNHAASGRHAADGSPVLIHAGRDVVNPLFLMPKFARVTAGRDLRGVSLLGQNVRTGDATILSAGRDIIYPAAIGLIEWGGPGRLDLLAGRDVDLGFSAGITTVGRTANPALTSERGADITVVAGLGRDIDIDAFMTGIVAASPANRAALVGFVNGKLGTSSSSFETALAGFAGFTPETQREFAFQVFFDELVASGREANTLPGAGFERGYAAVDALFPGSRSTDANPYGGDLKLAFSRIYTIADADISLLVPGGLVNVGLAVPPQGVGSREPSQLGIVAQRAGSVRIFASDDILVNASRIFTLRGGDIAIWSTLGDIDAGRGAKSAISAPPPTVLVDPSGRVTLDFAGAVAGSGIRAIITSDEVTPGDVDLIAPSGIVDAGDAGIGSAGNLNVAAQQVVGLDNIQVGGTSTGVPAETSNLGAALAGASAVASSASTAASEGAASATTSQAAAPLAASAFGFLEVFLEGFGGEVCKPDDTDCLKRNQ